MKIIAITTGDHRGIGAEIIAKSIKKLKLSNALILGEPELYKPYKKLLPQNWQVWDEQELLSSSGGPLLTAARKFNTNTVHFARANAASVPPSLRPAFCSGRYIEIATHLALRSKVKAIVTGPIDKSEIKKAGFNFDGHTEMLQSLCGSPSVTMMLAGKTMRVSLVTTHVPVSEIARKLNASAIVQCLENTAEGLRKYFGIRKPRIAVLALNPHAGDNGLFGDEEITKIKPAIHFASTRLPHARIEGPFASDGFFAQWKTRHEKTFDAVVCMYHDQGLIPVKLYDFENTVNLTLGLPILRTSVDHGIGLDLVGKNKADPSSMIAAIKLALRKL